MSALHLTEEDKANTQLVALVNHKLAEHFFHGENPVGKRLRIGTPETETPWVTIVGEVADVKRLRRTLLPKSSRT